MNKPKTYFSKIRDVDFGTDVTVVEPCNLYECRIGDSTFIGPFVEIQSDTIIGSNCKKSSRIHLFVAKFKLEITALLDTESLSPTIYSNQAILA